MSLDPNIKISRHFRKALKMEDIAMTIRQKLTTTALLGRFGLAAVLPGASAIADDVQWDKTFYDVETGATVDLTEGGGSPLEEATLPQHIIEAMEIQ